LPDGGVALAITTFGVHGSRDSLYVDAAFTKSRLATIQTTGGLQPDPTFTPAVVGDVYASPLYLEAGIDGKDVLFVATAENNVYAIDAAAGTVLWHTPLGAGVPCGEVCDSTTICPFIGIISTPVLDVARRELVVVGTLNVPATSSTAHHVVFGLSIDSGSVLWSIDLDNTVSGFNARYQGQRASLLELNGVVYIPAGGYAGDCTPYWGWVIGIPLSTAPAGVFYWRTPNQGGAVWGQGALATDGTSLFAVTGNGFSADGGVQAPPWNAGLSDAMLRLTTSLTFSDLPADYFAFANWQQLNADDKDFSSNGTVLFEMAGSGSGHLALCIGKLQNAYLIDRANMGGMNTALAEAVGIATDDATGGMATYQTTSGRYVAYNAPCDTKGDILGVLKVNPGTPPTVSQAFCVNGGAGAADQGGSPIVTTSDGSADAVVWMLGASGDNKLHAVDGETGVTILTSPSMNGLIHWVAPLVAKGSIYVPVNGRVYAFRVQQ
jgi:hypothetical protein